MPAKRASNSGEAKFLASYDASKYPRPSVTSDIVALSIQDFETGDFRRPTRSKICVLLIRRGGYPFKDCWALPGGFLTPNETIEACAARELDEETGLRGQVLMPLRMFSKPGRDPRAWVITQAFLAIVRKSESKVAGGDDAREARWFEIDYSRGDNTLDFELRSGDIRIAYSASYGRTGYGQSVLEGCAHGARSEELAFDHAEIVAAALLRLNSADADELAFAFLPTEFTVSELQFVHEFMAGHPLLSPNFRRKASTLVEPIEGSFRGAVGHRPAAIFRRRP